MHSARRAVSAVAATLPVSSEVSPLPGPTGRLSRWPGRPPEAERWQTAEPVKFRGRSATTAVANTRQP
jgi:hypothetical protein